MQFTKMVAAVVVGELIATVAKGALISYVRKSHPDIYKEAMRRREGED